MPKPAAVVPPPPSAGRVLRATGAAGADDVFDASTESEGSSAGDEGSDAEDPVVFAGQVFSRKFRDDAGGSDVYEGVVVDRATSEAGKRGWKVSRGRPRPPRGRVPSEDAPRRYAADGYEEVLSTRRLAALVARPPVAASRPRRPPSDGARGVILSFGEGGWFSAVWIPNLQPDFNVRIFDGFDARLSAVLRELDESNRFVQKSAESTSI